MRLKTRNLTLKVPTLGKILRNGYIRVYFSLFFDLWVREGEDLGSLVADELQGDPVDVEKLQKSETALDIYTI